MNKHLGAYLGALLLASLGGRIIWQNIHSLATCTLGVGMILIAIGLVAKADLNDALLAAKPALNWVPMSRGLRQTVQQRQSQAMKAIDDKD